MTAPEPKPLTVDKTEITVEALALIKLRAAQSVIESVTDQLSELGAQP